MSSGTLNPLARWLAHPREQRDGPPSAVSIPMIKSLIAFSIFALLGAAVIALPGFAPPVEAGETAALAKEGRLDVRPAFDCSQQTWPNFEAPCLRDGVSGVMVREARLVTARR